MAARNGYPSNIEGMVTKPASTSIRITSKLSGSAGAEARRTT